MENFGLSECNRVKVEKWPALLAVVHDRVVLEVSVSEYFMFANLFQHSVVFSVCAIL